MSPSQCRSFCRAETVFSLGGVHNCAHFCRGQRSISSICLNSSPPAVRSLTVARTWWLARLADPRAPGSTCPPLGPGVTGKHLSHLSGPRLCPIKPSSLPLLLVTQPPSCFLWVCSSSWPVSVQSERICLPWLVGSSEYRSSCPSILHMAQLPSSDGAVLLAYHSSFIHLLTHTWVPSVTQPLCEVWQAWMHRHV